jgi:hypothetical protein
MAIKKTEVAAAPVPAGPDGRDVARFAAPMAEPEGGWPADEFTGVAGRFVRDPFTGVRSPAADDLRGGQ